MVTVKEFVQGSKVAVSRQTHVLEILGKQGFAADSEADETLFNATTAELQGIGLLLQEAKALQTHKPWLHKPDLTFNNDFERVSPVYDNANRIIGTVARIRSDGFCVAALHVWMRDGVLLDATAFGGFPMKVLASFPQEDIILLQGPRGPAFRMPIVGPDLGRDVMMIVYRQSLLQETEQEVPAPLVAQGHIQALSDTLDMVTASYHPAVADTSGAVACYNSHVFAGVHTDATYHWNNAQGSQDNRGATNDNLFQEMQELVLHDVDNMCEKSDVAEFLLVDRIVSMAASVGLWPTAAMWRKSFVSKRPLVSHGELINK